MIKSVSLIHLALPFVGGFLVYLLPRWHRIICLGVLSVSLLFPLYLIVNGGSVFLNLKNNFGVTLYLDSTTGYFLLTNSLVTLATLIYCWQEGRNVFFYSQLMILFASVNGAFLSYDFITFYVAIEVLSIAAFLLISYNRNSQSIWIGLRYLFVSNVSMLFYLIGAVLVYKANHGFSFQGLVNSPPEAIALILLGLTVKGGVFISGLWLPLTHASVETPLSALLSGVVVKAGLFPLIRLATLSEDLEIIVGIMALAAVYLGGIQIIWAKDIKRLLALSTLSQLGYIIAAPPVAGFYALSHGLAKATLFLTTGKLPSRSLEDLWQTGIKTSLWWVMTVSSLSLMGIPPLAGFVAKTVTLQQLLPWQTIPLTVATLFTSIAFTKILIIPKNGETTEIHQNHWLAFSLLTGIIITTGFIIPSAYTPDKLAKSLILAATGFLISIPLLRGKEIQLPPFWENLENLLGMMSITLIGLFWMALF
ncbi:MAG: cation:proton antiporter [Geminocystis sp.]|nr:cation:proton antiporter [Geminocystis sp.]